MPSYQACSELIEVLERRPLIRHVTTVSCINNPLHVRRLFGQHSLGYVDEVLRLALADEEGNSLMAGRVRSEVIRLDPMIASVSGEDLNAVEWNVLPVDRGGQCSILCTSLHRPRQERYKSGVSSSGHRSARRSSRLGLACWSRRTGGRTRRMSRACASVRLRVASRGRAAVRDEIVIVLEGATKRGL